MLSPTPLEVSYRDGCFLSCKLAQSLLVAMSNIFTYKRACQLEKFWPLCVLDELVTLLQKWSRIACSHIHYLVTCKLLTSNVHSKFV